MHNAFLNTVGILLIEVRGTTLLGPHFMQHDLPSRDNSA